MTLQTKLCNMPNKMASFILNFQEMFFDFFLVLEEMFLVYNTLLLEPLGLSKVIWLRCAQLIPKMWICVNRLFRIEFHMLCFILNSIFDTSCCKYSFHKYNFLYHVVQEMALTETDILVRLNVSAFLVQRSTLIVETIAEASYCCHWSWPESLKHISRGWFTSNHRIIKLQGLLDQMFVFLSYSWKRTISGHRHSSRGTQILVFNSK